MAGKPTNLEGKADRKVSTHGEHESAPNSAWPSSIINLAGAWRGLPTAEEIRKNLKDDIRRVKL